MRQGFSLVEMLLALSIMVLLASFVLPNIQKFQNKSYQMASEVNLRTFQACIENYFLDNNAYPTGGLGANELYALLKAGDYMGSCPTNPYYKTTYASTQTKGKIAYASTSGDDYSLTLYGSDGQSAQLVLNKL